MTEQARKGKKMAKRLRFRMEAKETGLRIQGTRAYELMWGDQELARVCPHARFGKDWWYWHTVDATPLVNVCHKKMPLELARAEAMEHARAYIASLSTPTRSA